MVHIGGTRSPDAHRKHKFQSEWMKRKTLRPQPNFAGPGFLPGKLEFYNHIAVLPDKTACHLCFGGGDAGHCLIILTVAMERDG